jgi:seryl-tRNA synthetase
MIRKGYNADVLPLLMRDEVMMGTVIIPGSEEQTYQMERTA